MIRQILHQLATMKQQSQTPWRQLCDRVPYASVMRWRQRQRLGTPLWRCPGPKKSVPLDWTEFYPLLRQLRHGRVRPEARANSTNGSPTVSPAGNSGRWCRIFGQINSLP